MRKIVFIPVFCLLVSALWLTGCSGKYADAKALNAEFVDMTETYLDDLEKSDNAKDVAKAMNRYADDMEKIWPKMKKMAEKYPELKDKKAMPEELKESQQAVEEMGQKMGNAFGKIMPHMSDPDVQKAQQRISAVMTGQ
jgi:F0F1-type ATP synthase membrane subunit b/b'